MIKETFGKKIGMTQMFGPEGELLAVTLVEVEPVCVLEKVTYQNKQKAKIGCFKVKDTKVSKVKKPQKGYFEKIGVPAYKLIKEVAIEDNADFSFSQESEEKPKSTESNKEEQKSEVRSQKSEEESPKTKGEVQEEDKKEAKKEKAEVKEPTVNQQEKAASKETSQQEEKQQEKSEKESKEEKKEEKGPSRYVGIEIFSQGQKITVKSKTKGKGFAGAIKRHKMHRQPSSHGSGMHRRVGSVGASATPSKIVKNKKMPGHLGASYRVTKNLEILKVDKENKIIFIKGNVSGSRGAIIRLIKQS